MKGGWPRNRGSLADGQVRARCRSEGAAFPERPAGPGRSRGVKAPLQGGSSAPAARSGLGATPLRPEPGLGADISWAPSMGVAAARVE